MMENDKVGKALDNLTKVNPHCSGKNATAKDTPISRSAKTAPKNKPLYLKQIAKVEIAQVNAVDVNDVLSKQAELEDALTNIINEKGLDLFLFVVTDILNNDSVGLALGRAADVVEQAYNVKLQDNKAVMKGVVSRKSQIVPVLTDIFNKR